MEQLWNVLYGMSGIAGVVLYVPQIIRYHRDPHARLSISLICWSGWMVIAAITMMYALVVVKSYLIGVVAGLNIVAQFTVLLYGIQARLAKRPTSSKHFFLKKI